MTSGSGVDTSAAANRELARLSAIQSLAEKYKFKNTIQQGPQTSGPSSSSTAGPPAQSRDATARSRFFHSNPSTGTVLVPNSRPIAQRTPGDNSRPYQLSFEQLPTPGFSHTYPGQFARHAQADPLSRPSGFIASKPTNTATFARPKTTATRRVIDDDDNDDGSYKALPRKRLHFEPHSPDPLNLRDPPSPSSPEIVRPGQKRRIISNSTLLDSPTRLDDIFPEARTHIAGPSKPRIVRQRPESSEKEDPNLTRFVILYPLLPRDRVVAAYHDCGGDIKRATQLLEGNPNAARGTPTSSPSMAPRLIGRVTEIDEEREAARAAAKEKAAKSSIYKRRAEIDQPTPKTPSPSTTIFIDSSPIAPQPARSTKSKAKKRVVDSGSEVESDDDVKVLSSGLPGDDESVYQVKALEGFNTLALEALRELTGCTEEQANTIISSRPFKSIEDLEERLGQGKRKAGPAGISPRVFEDCAAIYKGYGSVDKVLQDCERVGRDLTRAIAAWSGKTKGKDRESSVVSTASSVVDEEDGTLNLISLTVHTPQKGFITTAPSILAPGVQLKDYQLIGVNWLNLLYSKGLSCILADEMGLGKTIQVISFFAYLKENDCLGSHLIVVPSSTLENWCREFERFAPTIAIQTYYAGKENRAILREELLERQMSKGYRGKGAWEVLITTYNLAVGDSLDRRFLRRIRWKCCVFDEGHILKNFQSQRYAALARIESKWKLLLTGTPLQNNLQELVSLLCFILPEQFAEAMDDLRAIFKVKGDSKVSLLSQERVSRAKKMLTPFVLRRRKDQVLKDLPKKTERIEWCEMTSLQKSIYRDAMHRSRKTVIDLVPATEDADAETGTNGKASKKSKVIPKAKEKQLLENSTNVLMELRKAAIHPMLFRQRFDDKTLTSITRQLLKEPDFRKRQAVFEYVKEDMEVMTDAELQAFCMTYKSTRKYLLDENVYLDAGKIEAMLKLLAKFKKEGRKCLIFSQFTQVLDILQAILKQRSVKYLLLTGTTPVDVRQALVDEFTEDASIPVFLLSTKAGGMGINLTAASVVILFDQDFNPHNDRQAADRAYRIGQRRDVEIVKLVTRGTIEEDMLRLGETKLALDEAVAGEAAAAAAVAAEAEVGGKGSKGESAPEKTMRTSLMESLRKQFEEEDRLEKAGVGRKPVDDADAGDAQNGVDSDVEMVEVRDTKVKDAKATDGTEVKTIVLDSDSELTDIE